MSKLIEVHSENVGANAVGYGMVKVDFKVGPEWNLRRSEIVTSLATISNAQNSSKILDVEVATLDFPDVVYIDNGRWIIFLPGTDHVHDLDTVYMPRMVFNRLISILNALEMKLRPPLPAEVQTVIDNFHCGIEKEDLKNFAIAILEAAKKG